MITYETRTNWSYTRPDGSKCALITVTKQHDGQIVCVDSRFYTGTSQLADWMSLVIAITEAFEDEAILERDNINARWTMTPVPPEVIGGGVVGALELPPY